MKGLNADSAGKSRASVKVQTDERNGDKYRDRILNAARMLFHEHGFDQVSMYQIAKTAEIGQGSLYRRYADKGEICSDLLRNNSERILEELEEDVRGRKSDTSALELLRNIIRKTVDFIDERADLLLMIKSEFMGKRQLTQYEHPFFQRLNAIMTDLLTQAVVAGEVRDVEPHFAASALISVLSPDLYLYQQKFHGATKEDMLQGITRIFVSGLQEPAIKASQG
ncbi:MAG: TetR/AcrR family transcriptional regulator [Gorillibacterium sp.]|nr:TetR/AcrR family transcriptional regulator [Gorillibacterium sp.]